MAEWRFLRGWSDPELEDRLRRIDGLERNFRARQGEMTPDRGWTRYYSEAVIARERPGPPEDDGDFARARALVADYRFSDPRIVTAHFDPETPLRGRPLLLEFRVLGLHYLCGAVVAVVRSGTVADGGSTGFAFRYDTLDGHIEAGSEWFVLKKEHRTGAVRFRIQAAWRPGDFPNWWSRVGFHFLVRRYQRAWHRLAYVRLRRLLGAEGLRPLPAPGRLFHEGPKLPSPGVFEVSGE